MVDDLGKEWVSCYGSDDVQTPHIDALAKTGMLFTNAYSMPQCTPSRATLLTGKYPYNNGWVNHWDVPRWGVGYFDWKKRENMTFARLLRDAGYATVAAGKWQINDFRVEPEAMQKHGFDDWFMWTGYEAENPPSGERYWNPYIHTREGSKTYQDEYGPDLFTDFLIDFMKKKQDQPLMMYYPMVLTHGPLHNPPHNQEVEGVKERFKAMVEYADKMVGKLVLALDETGLREDTIVIFTTDNGSPQGISAFRNGVEIPGGKSTKTEAGTCAPFIVNGPGRVPEGVVTDALTDFTDLLPTFADLAGKQVPSDLEIDGHSIAPLLRGEATDTQRGWIISLGHGPAKMDKEGVRGQNDFASRVVRDKRYKVWIDENRQIVRLHDLKEDPLEQKNLLDSATPEHKQALEKFQIIIETMPEKDARPMYVPREALPWDRKLEG